MDTVSGMKAKEERDKELSYLRKEEAYLEQLIDGVDRKINSLHVEAMVLKRQIRQSMCGHVSPANASNACTVS